jgi:predicted nucleotidyltransferase
MGEPPTATHYSGWRQRYHLQRIGLFGSTARNEATADSDLDVWVELHPLTPFATVHLKQELEALLQRPVDLVRLRERMNPALRQAILREGVSAWCTMATSGQPGETGQMNVVPDAPMP